MSHIDDIAAYAESLMKPPVLAVGVAAELAAQQLYTKALHDRLILWMREMEQRIQRLEADSNERKMAKPSSPLSSTSTPTPADDPSASA